MLKMLRKLDFRLDFNYNKIRIGQYKLNLFIIFTRINEFKIIYWNARYNKIIKRIL